MAKEVLKTNEISFSDRPQTLATDYLSYGSKDFSFAPYGPYWKFMKKLCMSQLLGGQTLDILEPIRRDEVNTFLRFMYEKAKVGLSVDVGSELIRMTNNVISRMLMSERCSGDGSESGELVRKLIRDFAEVSGKFNLSDYIWFCKNLDLQGFGKRLKEVRDRFDEMMKRIIDEHECERRNKGKLKDGIVKDLLDILLDISEDEKSEMKLTRENIKAFIMDIFAAGTDTSAITIQWALSELINNPTILQKAVQEIESITSNNKKLIQESDIPNLPYLQSIVKETLRLHPTGPLIIRQSNQECTIGGYTIPSKTGLFVNVWAIGRDSKYWENALEFRPERFMCGDDMDVRGQHYQLLPFGSGRRGCPGTTLALKVVGTTLGVMIQCFDWNIFGGNVDMEEGIGITLPRAHPLICSPVARINSDLLM
ncbi:hypothetical protein RD792_008028 [Penstemon davidsonii]|uniref:Cytochrome P450 n=1 Tax=Penstemon davidsonii TaxID=160366 RepID=A0ABR0D7Z1_9LAMI|nr:hypothetical protein RD792_008028 [Penstemon davidsonii]